MDKMSKIKSALELAKSLIDMYTDSEMEQIDEAIKLCGNSVPAETLVVKKPAEVWGNVYNVGISEQVHYIGQTKEEALEQWTGVANYLRTSLFKEVIAVNKKPERLLRSN